MRKQIAAANWKMNLTLAQAEQLTNELLAGNHNLTDNQLAVFAVPFPYLIKIQEKLNGKSNVYVAAQNCAATNNGAYTGEVSTEILKSIQVKYALIGHSERREYFNETNAILVEKLNRAFEQQVIPIFCCGEPLAIREAATHNHYVELQLQEGLFHLTGEQMKDFIIAYEPIWAIGTGKTASSGEAQEMHAHIRQVIEAKYGQDISESVSILYGGSVKAANAAELFSRPDVDGGLVGGASLIAPEFNTIIKSLKQ